MTTGFRAWRVVLHGEFAWLTGVVMQIAWPYREPMRGVLDSPSGGVHAWLHLDEAYEHCRQNTNFGVSTRLVLGSVGIAGRILEHDLGYRAELAYPAALYPSANQHGPSLKLVQALSRLYGCEVGARVPYPGPPWWQRMRTEKAQRYY